MKTLVVGTGFDAIYTAFILRQDYDADVVMVDPSMSFGAVMSGVKKHGFSFRLWLSGI